MTIINNGYFEWLMRQIPGAKPSECQHLFNKEFYASVPNDGNRFQDGLVLRENFQRETGEKPFEGTWCSCNMLEMMIGLARRMRDLMEDQIEEQYNTVSRWFCEMLDNLGKPRQRATWDAFRWDDAIETVLQRTYKPTGEGGLFPRSGAVTDQRTVELWLQMQGYLMDWY